MKISIFIMGCTAMLFCGQTAFAQKATITESVEQFVTYPYSDPDPVAKMTRFYPYYGFDGFTNKPVEQGWKIITLENKYVKVLVAPQIGGKVLGAIEKSTGEEFLYFNKVVKFRDISMRSAWTSGGIEFNFGSIGHAPTTASPVNYLLKNNDDGSVSCFVGAPDITSRTEWRVEIRLPAEASYFETRAIWYNPYDLKTSLYNWMTAAVDASDDLRFYFPGHTQIGHVGEAGPWPVNREGVDISRYKNNNFEGSKSYHVLGEYAEHFLCYFHNKEFGLGHWSPYDEKPGQKIFLWALSREGALWKDLLTDPGNNQYTEIQTGLLFNQASPNSTYSPFKHLFFDEGSEHIFRELWFPVKGIGGMVKANESGSLNLERKDGQVKIGFCANREISGDVVVKADGREIGRKNIHLKPTETYTGSMDAGNANVIEFTLGDIFSFTTDELEERKLTKPVLINEGFDWESEDGLLTDGTEMEKERAYPEARVNYEKVLKLNPLNTEALTRMAGLCYRSMEYELANRYALKALANDTYYPEANYIFGLLSKKSDKIYDALDGFSVAARSASYRVVANAQIAAVQFADGKMQKCLEYAGKALDYDRYNMNALRLKALAYEKTGQLQQREKVLDEILGIDPLNAFARFEKKDDFQKVLNYEMPHEIFLELAIYYHSLGMKDRAAEVLKASPPSPLVDYWMAFLLNDLKYLDKALLASPEWVYPSRSETADVLLWANTKKDHWKTKYYLGLVFWSEGRDVEARKYFNGCGSQADYFGFYLTRYRLMKEEGGYNGLADLQKAIELKPGEWRCFKALSDYFEENRKYEESLAWAKKGYSQLPDNYILAYQLSRNLLIAGKYPDALDILTKTNILPNEGASYGRTTYRQACMMDAMANYRQNRNKAVLSRIHMAREWPENLGVGKPYDTDERIEDYLESLHWIKNRNSTKAKLIEEKIIASTLNARIHSSGDFLGAMLLKKAGQEGRAMELLTNWKEQEPENQIAAWSLAKFAGNNQEADQILDQIRKESGGSLFNPKIKDTDFVLVQALAGF